MDLINQVINAIRNNELDLVESLLEQGAPINALDTSGQGALHWAAAVGRLEPVKLLVARNANVGIVNNRGATPLHRAVNFGNNEVIKFLLEKGAEANAVNHRGESPLHGVTNTGRYEAARILLEKGAKVNLRDKYQLTVLSKVVVEESIVEITSRRKASFRLCIIELLRAGAYSYPNLDSETKRYLEDYWESGIDAVADESFYTSLLLAGVSTNGKVFVGSPGVIQNNIVSTIAEWLKPLNLTQEECRKLTPKVLRALPQIIQCFKLFDDPKASELGHYYFKKATKNNQNKNLLEELDAKIPEEIMGLINESFNKDALIGILVNKLMNIYSLPQKVAEYLLRDGIKHRDEYSAYPSQLFDHDWKTSCSPPYHKNFRLTK